MTESKTDLSISDTEKRAIEELRSKYPSLPTQVFLDINTLFHNSKILGASLLQSIEKDIYQGQLVMLGFVRRTSELLLGGVQEVACSNRYLVASVLRGVIETFSAVAWISEKPIRLPELAHERGISEGKLTNVAYKRIPGLKDDYKRTSEWIHPSSESFYVGLGIIDEKQHIVSVQIPGAVFSQDEVLATLGAIMEGCQMILTEIQSLITSQPKILHSGKVFAKSVSRKGWSVS